MIMRAGIDDLLSIKWITEHTIKNIYPHYYPPGAVQFFLDHHSTDNIRKDIEDGNVYYYMMPNGSITGTVTINGDEINRLFVLPDHQGKGYGSALIDFAEKIISEYYPVIKLSASFPAKQIYLRKGYTSVNFHVIDAPDGDKLCYDYMEKPAVK